MTSFCLLNILILLKSNLPLALNVLHHIKCTLINIYIWKIIIIASCVQKMNELLKNSKTRGEIIPLYSYSFSDGRNSYIRTDNEITP